MAGVRIEWAQFGHFDYFEIIHNTFRKNKKDQEQFYS